MKKTKRIIIIFLILTLQSYILISNVRAFSPASQEMYEGIDVSGWQESINFSEVKDEGIEIVYIKASEGTNFIDPYFEQNYTNAKEKGLKVGFYHYLTATNIEQAVKEANFFASVINGKAPDCKLCMDFESFENLTIQEINEIGITFMQTVEKITKKEMIIYSDTSNASNIFTQELTNYPLWVAQYEVSEPTPNGNWNTWVGWQYTDIGQINGISGNVDRDKFTPEIFLNESTEIQMQNNQTEQENEKKQTTITIKWGETLSYIAIKYNTTVATLAELNNITNPNLIYAGQTLILPTKETNQEIIGSKAEEKSSEQNIYIVQKGDTLNKIAHLFETTVNAIAQENNIRNKNLIYIGQRLRIPTNNYDMNHILYKIKWGDTLWSISRRYNVSIATIVRLNRIQNPSLIYAGNTIRI